MKNGSSKRFVGLAAAALVVAAAVIWWLARPAGPFAFHWPKGSEYVYRLDYSNHNRTRIMADLSDPGAGPEAEAILELEGRLVLRSHGPRDGAYLLDLSVRDLSRCRYELLGAPLTGGDGRPVCELLPGAKAVLEVTPEGRIRALRFGPDADALAAGALQALASELQWVVRPEASDWREDEETLLGRGPVAYAWGEGGATAAEPSLSKRRERYDLLLALGETSKTARSRVEGERRSALSREGHVVSISGEERMRAGADLADPAVDAAIEVELALERVGRFDADAGKAAAFASWGARTLGQAVVSDAAERASLERQVAGMTVEKISGDLLKFGPGGMMPDHNRWIWRATGLLELDPEAAAALVPVFEDPGMSSKARLMLLDLLAGTGTAEVQAVLCRLLEGETARGDGQYVEMLQRLSTLRAPTKETAAFVEALYRRALSGELGEGLAEPVAYALGAVAARRRAAGDGEAAGRMNGLLLEGLAGAEDARQRRHYLEALGNVGAATNVAAIAALATDEDADVRRSVARALRKTQTPEAEKVVLGLAGDEEGGVQQAALAVMDRYELEASHLESLSGIWESKGVAYGNWGELATLLGHRLGRDPALDRASRELLVKVGSAPEISPKLLYRIRQMIE
jgi:hypothetical protein